MFFYLLFVLAFLERTVGDLGPNIEILTTALVLGAFLHPKKNVWLTLAVVVASDLILGNSRIFLFTWSGFLIPAFLLSRPRLVKRFSGGPKRRDLMKFLTFGLGSNVFFYLWTNFGVWALDSWGMYDKTLGGLTRCYVNGLPFLRNQLVSSLIFIPVFYISYRLLAKYSKIVTSLWKPLFAH